MRVLIALLVWAAAIAGGIGVSTVVADSIHTSGSGSASGGGGSSVDVGAITASDSDSLFHTTNFSKALSTATTALGANAQLDSFTLYPGYLSIDAVNGKTDINFYVDATGSHSETTSNVVPTSDALFPLSDITSDFPATISQRIATLAKTPLSQLHYLIAETGADNKSLVWYAYPVSGSSVSYFQMKAPHGRLFEQLQTGGLQRVKG
jgi:hypothetical protein